jgi:Gram-negative bacterial TonB protein C-terminal
MASGQQKTAEKSMSVEIVIGRDGRVKEARTYSPVENAIETAVLTAIKKWTFQPQNLDGVPEQIATELTLPFPADYQKVDANQPQIRPMFDRMRRANDLRLDGAPGFHMKASFKSENGSAKGTYEETWLSSKKWRREVSVNGSSIVEVRTESSFYRSFPGKHALRLADDVIDSISFSLPGDNGSDLHDADWRAVNARLSNLITLRLSNGYISPQGKPDALTVVYFVDEKSAIMRGRYHYSILTVFNDLQAFGEKTVARRLTTLDGDLNKMEISIETLEPAANVNEGIFSMDGVKPLYSSETEDERFTQPKVVYSARPSIPDWHGRVTCAVKIDEHGHVRDVDVKGTMDESVIKSIRAALMSWESGNVARRGARLLGNPRTQAGVRVSFIIVIYPGTQSLPQVPFVQRDHEFQTLAAHCSDQAFAVRIRLGRSYWRS